VLKLIVGVHHVVEVHVMVINVFLILHVVACVHHVVHSHHVHLLSQVPALLFIMLLLSVGVHQVVLPLYGWYYPYPYIVLQGRVSLEMKG
jgi:hypothetical protein